MSDQPLVSVVLPTYDRPDMLIEAVDSVANQTYPSIELIVVDDCSPTPAADVLEERGPDDLEWRCYRHEENRGANTARNTGIRESVGECIAFLDDDDRWEPDKIELQINAFDDDDVGVVVVGQRYISRDTQTATNLPSVEGDATAALIGDATAGPFSTIAVRRSAIEDAGTPDERFPAWQDREWLLRLSCHCEFASVRQPLVIRRYGDYEQIGNDFEGKRDTSYPLYLEKHQELAAEHDRERLFEAQLATGVAAAGITNGHYSDARSFAVKAVRTKPRFLPAYLYLTLAVGGPYLYEIATRCKHGLTRLGRNLSRLGESVTYRLGRST
ncbi:glycosyltransferase family 2 protein [Natronolimnobius sp. AArcel1]|uniref:glycosyltransferase family 2 protein n=1 Tax=Natronolimnobius sp. AArcel1 TaxID=1679093 RepID=UPI0013EBF24E|nr:glycosyltransferase family A protein [Natronolimnobius sp. AArcel1]NGM68566.1 glycosyltransferase family 2 protein [Natronolimnobius sp. AArcel1]